MAQEKVVKKKVFLDFRSVLLKLEREKGVKKLLGDISQESGFNRMTIANWGKEAPLVVGFIYEFLKDNDLNFEDLVKECFDNGK
jgi:hypothetical protein